MSARTWVILGATSIIAEEFAHMAARSGNALILVGRNLSQLNILASDIRLRYAVACDCFYKHYVVCPKSLIYSLLSVPC